MDYKNGKIYAIRSHQTEQIYIGSTTQPLTKRLSKHKAQNCSSRLILQYEDAYIELIENFPCESKTDLENDFILKIINVVIKEDHIGVKKNE